jgi:hypothetical protein
MAARLREPDLSFIGGNLRNFRLGSLVFQRKLFVFQLDTLLALSGAAGGTKVPYARTGHTINFIGEQFWGRAARASWTRQESQDARYFCSKTCS